MKKLKFIISGGGTGGHIFPALAIAQELERKFSGCEILFVGANGRMEMEKIPDAGYTIKGLDVVGIQRSFSINSLVKNFSFPIRLLKSLNAAKKIIESFNPDVVIGVGGYASGPTLRMANRLGVPTLIQEQNSYAGLTNKWLSKKAHKICVAYENMSQFFPEPKLVLTGNPVRKDLMDMDQKSDLALKHFNIDKGDKVILVIGGSLGAKSINEGLLASLDILKNQPIQLIWQVGKRYFDQISNHKKLQEFKNVHAMPFIKKMDLAYEVADLVISRAGALSISEITLTGKASLLIPSPNVAEDHQRKNAMALVKRNAAVLVNDNDTRSALGKALNLLKDELQISEIAKNAKKMGKPNAARDIVNEIEKLI